MKLVFLERESFGTDIAIDAFAQYGEIITYPVLDKEKMTERVQEADILFINKAKINAQTMGEAPNLKLICEMATGFDNVDLKWCRERGIAVANVPNYSTTAVAQHAVALALALLGKTVHYDQVVKSGEYAAQEQFAIFDQPIIELAGKTWGIAGLGNIGRCVARIAEAFGCHVITYSTSGRVHEDGQYEQVSFEELLERSDVLSLHCPMTEKTKEMMNDETFAKMKRNAVFINVSRGGLVDQAALIRAIENGTIAGAGVDVLVKEPMCADDPILQIQDSSKLIVTPHMAWASVEARQRDADITLANLEAFLRGERKNRVD